jgi:hypothetical protein
VPPRWRSFLNVEFCAAMSHRSLLLFTPLIEKILTARYGSQPPERIGRRGLESRFRCWSCLVSWSVRFAEPIVLEDGSKLATLRDAIRHLAQITPNPKATCWRSWRRPTF